MAFFMNNLLPLRSKCDNWMMKMKLKIWVGLFVLGAVTATAKSGVYKDGDLQRNYMDSLAINKLRIDSLRMSSDDSRFSMLFSPLTYYRSPANHFLRLESDSLGRDSLGKEIDNALLHVYLSRPNLVKTTETKLLKAGTPLEAKVAKKTQMDLVEQVAPKAIEIEAEPVDLYVSKPNFWTFSGDYYLQFLQNYVSDNWYKGGESNYSMLGSVTVQANYNNKQKVKWDNKLEMRLGYLTSKGDSVHKFRTSDDLLRYTSKLGLQATKKWYYTVQLIAQTQFARSVKSNDAFVYSDFFSPFNLNLSVGMDYSVDWFKHKLKGTAHLAPLALNWKHVGREALIARYGLDENKHDLVDYGSECTFDLTWQIAENIKWKTRLWGYTTYKRAEIEWENTISFQFNRYISSNLFVYPRFDDGTTRKEGDSYWQLKEYLSVGFSYSF